MTAAEGPRPVAARQPLYARLLRLRRTRLHWLLRALYFEGALALGVVLYLADAASAWVIVALPVTIAVAVKIYDVVSDSIAR
jgi:hypothetical protein